MTETDEKGKKKLSLSSGGTLSLGKKIETSQVKQSFSHGRSKTVQVERRRKRAPIAQNIERRQHRQYLWGVYLFAAFETVAT